MYSLLNTQNLLYMQEVIDFFKGLFATDLWPARWKCGYWSDFHGWLYIISDLTIWFSYFAIPVIIIGYLYKKKYELKYTHTYFLFASFILLCGSTHLIDASMFWMPMYRFNAIIRFLTGVVSLFTVFHLIKILPDAFLQKTSVVLEKEIAKRAEIEKELSEANEGLQAFAYMASHDLQEPLRKISMLTTRLYEENKNNVNESSKQWMEKTIAAAIRMQKMVTDILALSSLSKEVELKPIDMNTVIRDVIADLEMKIQERDATIETDDLPVVTGHREYLIQLFINLIGNAIKFSNKRPIVKINAESIEDKVQIYIQDNGIGMKQEDTDKIFQAFRRLHGKEAYEGSGIGLAICKKIVDIHDGKISVKSKPGEGTTFIVELLTPKNI